MEGQFSERVRDVISYSRDEAIRLRHAHIDTGHLLLGLLREGSGNAVKLMRQLGCDLNDLKRAIEARMADLDQRSSPRGNIPLTRKAEKALKLTYLEARLTRSTIIDTEHLLLSLLRDKDHAAAQVLRACGITYETIYEGVYAELGIAPIDLAPEPTAKPPHTVYEPPQRPSTGPDHRAFQTDGPHVLMTLAHLSTSPTSGGAYNMVLKEADGTRQLSIIIGAIEAQAIALELENIQPPRPMTHDLFPAFAAHFGVRIEAVCIDQICDGTFCSYLRATSEENEVLIDMRPSDAVAIAIRAEAPIYVHEDVLHMAE